MRADRAGRQGAAAAGDASSAGGWRRTLAWSARSCFSGEVLSSSKKSGVCHPSASMPGLTHAVSRCATSGLSLGGRATPATQRAQPPSFAHWPSPHTSTSPTAKKKTPASAKIPPPTASREEQTRDPAASHPRSMPSQLAITAARAPTPRCWSLEKWLPPEPPAAQPRAAPAPGPPLGTPRHAALLRFALPCPRSGGRLTSRYSETLPGHARVLGRQASAARRSRHKAFHASSPHSSSLGKYPGGICHPAPILFCSVWGKSPHTFSRFQSPH